MKNLVISVFLLFAIALIPVSAFASIEVTGWNPVSQNIGDTCAIEDFTTMLYAREDDQNIYINYYSDEFGIFFASSSDFGATWSCVLIDDTFFSIDGDFVWDGNNTFYYAFQDTADIYFAKSTNLGANWSTPTSIYTSNQQINEFFDMDYANNTIYIVVEDADPTAFGSAGIQDAVVLSTTNGGESWNTDILTGSNCADGSGNCSGDVFPNSVFIVQVDAQGDSAFVSWSYNNNDGVGYDIYGSISTDNGETWSPQDSMNISGGDTDGAGSFNRNHISVDESTFMIVYSSFSEGVMSQRSTDDGATWTSPVLVTEAPSLECTGDRFNTVQSGDRVIFACTSPDDYVASMYTDDFGLTWESKNIHQTGLLGLLGGTSAEIELYASGDTVLLGYENTNFTSSFFDIWTGSSSDLGETWTNDVLLNSTEFGLLGFDLGYHSAVQLIGNDNGALGFWSTEDQEGTGFAVLWQQIATFDLFGSDSVPPVISAIGNEPVIFYDGDSVFDGVQCIDDVDGLIVPNGTFEVEETGGITIDGEDFGLQSQNFYCKDNASNDVSTTIEYLVKRSNSGSGGSGGSSSGSGSDSGGTTATIGDASSPTTPLLSLTDRSDQTEQTDRAFDLLSFLYGNDVSDGQVKAPVSSGVPSSSQGTQSVSSGNPFADFFRNLFSFFG